MSKLHGSEGNPTLYYYHHHHGTHVLCVYCRRCCVTVWEGWKCFDSTLINVCGGPLEVNGFVCVMDCVFGGRLACGFFDSSSFHGYRNSIFIFDGRLNCPFSSSLASISSRRRRSWMKIKREENCSRVCVILWVFLVIFIIFFRVDLFFNGKANQKEKRQNVFSRKIKTSFILFHDLWFCLEVGARTLSLLSLGRLTRPSLSLAFSPVFFVVVVSK